MGSVLQFATILFMCWIIRDVVTNPTHSLLEKKFNRVPVNHHSKFLPGKSHHTDDNNSNHKDIDFESNYGKIHKFFEGLTFEKCRKNQKAQKTFYNYFRFDVKSKSIFNFLKFCFKFNKTPQKFGINFSSFLKEILEKKLDQVPADYYGKLMIQLSGNNQQDFGKKYTTIYKFLKDLKFKDIQTAKNSKKFNKFFKFYCKDENVFKFIKSCFQSPEKPTDFDTKFSSIWNIAINTDFSQVIKDYSDVLTGVLFGKNHEGSPKENGDDDDDNTNNNNGDIDFESNYGKIHKFFEGLTFEKCQKNQKAQKTFYNYFRFEVKSKSIFNFLKFCFKFNKTPQNFGRNFSSFLKEILKKKLDQVPADYYGKLLIQLSGNNQQDFGKKYTTIYKFLKDLKFKDMQTAKNSKQFNKFFKFYCKDEKVFKYIKYCFKSPKKPTNFDAKFSSIWNIIINTDFAEVIDEYDEIFNNIFSDKDSINKGDNKDNGNDSKDNRNGNKDNGTDNKDTGKNNKENGTDIKDKDKDKNNENDNKDKINDNTEKGKDNKNNGNNNKDNGNNSNKDTNGNTGYIDYDADYQEISDFFSSISFEGLQDEENMQTFYNYFNFECHSESVFSFLKFCFKYSEKPSDFSIHFTPLLNLILNLNLNEIPDIYNTMFTDNLSIKSNGYQFDSAEDYESNYNFLNNLNYAELQTEENFEKFFSIFGFYPVSENLFNFLKYCFQYKDMPANFVTNFQECIRQIFKSNCDVKPKFYNDFAKNLFGKSQLNYVDNYDAVFEFLRDLTYDEAQAGDNWDTFYYYFQCYPASESIFNVFKYMYQYEQKPTNFDANFSSALQIFFNSLSEDVSDNMYAIFDDNLFGGDDNNNNKEDFGTNYGDNEEQNEGDSGNDDRNDEGGKNNGDSEDNNGNSWSYSWSSDDQGENQEENSDSGDDQYNTQNSESYYYYDE